MARGKKTAEKISEKDGVVFFKVNKRLTQDEHEQLSEKIRFENKKSGLKIVLIPFSCDVADSGETNDK
jgi:hypothetical protein